MSFDIVVRRADADANPYKADEVVEPLLGDSLEAGIARGTAVLEEGGQGQKIITYEVEYRAGMRNGKLVRLRDSISGEFVYGKITGISITGQRNNEAFEVLMSLQVRVPTTFVITPT